ncbi:MAG: hypothetical protein AAB067_08770, partial [Planctomycetota bacterium]
NVPGRTDNDMLDLMSARWLLLSSCFHNFHYTIQSFYRFRQINPDDNQLIQITSVANEVVSNPYRTSK